VTFTDPEVAHVGLTASVAEKRGTAIDTYYVDLPAADQAAPGESSAGFVAVHTNYRNGQVIGATLVHPQASALIGEFARLIQEKRTPAALERSTIYCQNIAAAFQRIAGEYECRRRDAISGNSFKRWLIGWR
jgi:pyruvate/2-oxoglutarate dehydrogenase complex dihydrolipoamide dehydrogenase (E3) component